MDNAKQARAGRPAPCASRFGNGSGRTFIATGTTFSTLCGVYNKGGSGYDRPLNRTDIDTTATPVTTLLDLQHIDSCLCDKTAALQFQGHGWHAQSKKKWETGVSRLR